MDLKVIYEDNDILALEKPAGVVVFPEGETVGYTLIDDILAAYPDIKNVGEAPRHGVVHRLDKDTSGVLLVAKTPEALIFLQKQFKNRGVEKKYLALATGTIKDDSGTIKASIGRSPADPRKQKAYKEGELTPESAREAITTYKVVQRFEDYTLLEAQIETGRRHQIRVHLAFIHHPVAGDKKYGFKDSPCPEGLERQFLHASSLKIQVPSGETKTFESPLPPDLKTIIEQLS